MRPMHSLKHSWYCLILTLLCLGDAPAAGSHAGPATTDFFVSLRGNDNWSGRSGDPHGNDGPFATIARTRDAVRAMLKVSKPPESIRVVLCGGTYYLDSPLEFGPEDSGTEPAPVVYCAAARQRVVLSGGRRLEDGRWGEVNRRRAWVVDIAQVKAGTWRFRQLFVNGERRPRTRLPRQGEYRIESLPGYTGDFLRSPTRQFVYAPGDIVPAWRNLQDVEIVGITRWLDNRLPIESVNDGTRTVTFDRPSLFALVSGSRPGVYWVENVFEALDTPGQWYLDRPRGVLYYLPRPDEEMPSAEVVAPVLTQMVRVIGRAGAPVHDVRFEGLIFAHTQWQPPADYASSLQAGIEVPGALLFDYAERCAVTGGGIEHIGNYAIEVGVGCADIEIARNRITDIGAGGVRIGHFFSWETDGSGQLTERGLRRKAAMPQGPHSRRITVADNEIAHCGRFTLEAVGVFVFDPRSDQTTILGPRPGLAPYTQIVCGDKLYSSGYSGGHLFVYDPARPWTLSKGGPPGHPALDQADARSNPRYLGDFDKTTRVGLMHSSALGADGRIYFGGFGLRHYTGGGLGWYDPKTQKMDGFWKPLSGYAVQWIAPALDGRLIVLSTIRAADELNENRAPDEAKLFIYDVSVQEIVREIVPMAKGRTTGLIAEAEPGHLLGLTSDPEQSGRSILYGVDLTIGEVAFRKDLPAPVSIDSHWPHWVDPSYEHNAFVRGPDGFVWTYLKDVLVRIDPKDARVHVVGRIDPVGWPTFVDNDVYFSGPEQLRRIRNIVHLDEIDGNGPGSEYDTKTSAAVVQPSCDKEPQFRRLRAQRRQRGRWHPDSRRPGPGGRPG